MRRIVEELHRRTLWQVLGIYLMGSWLVLQVVDILSDNMGLPDWVFPFALVLLLIGLPIVLATAFVQEGLPGKSDDRPAPPGYARPGPGEYSLGDRPKDRSAAARPARPATAGSDSADVPGDEGLPTEVRRLFTWRNAIAGGGLAALTLALVTGGFMFMRSQGIGPAGTLVAKGVIDERAPILLADFESRGEEDLARMVTEAFRVDFSQTRVVRPVEASRVAQALQRMELDPTEPLTEDLARRIGRRDGIPAVVSGTVGRVGGGYVLTARIVTSAEGTVLASERETANDSTQILQAIDELSGKLRTRIGESFSGVRADAPLEQVTTKSLAALELYSEAIQVVEYESDPEQGVRLLRQALEEDPEFASAWRKLGIVLSNIRASSSEIEHAMTRAYELRERLTPRERYLAEASYYNRVREDRERAIAAYERMLDLDPADDWALNNVALLYAEEGDDQRALELMERSVEIDSSSVSLGNLIWHRVAVGDLDGADSALATMRRKYPDDRRSVDGPAVMAVQREDLEGAEQHLRETIGEVEGLNFLTAAGALSDVLKARGRLGEAAELTARAARVAGELEFPGTEYWGLFEEFWLNLMVRYDTAAALESLAELEDQDRLAALDELDRPYMGLAFANAWAGREDRALAYFEQFTASRPDVGPLRFRDDEAWLQADFALADGRYDAAVDGYHAARRLEGLGCQCGYHQLALSHERAGRADSAIAYYERFIDVHGAERLYRRAGQYGTALERIARLHDDLGNLGEAAAYYIRFADLWADADPDLQPRVAAARARAEEIVRSRG